MDSLDTITLNGLNRLVARAEVLLAEEATDAERSDWNIQALLMALEMNRRYDLYLAEYKERTEFQPVLTRLWQLGTHFENEVRRRVVGNTDGWE